MSTTTDTRYDVLVVGGGPAGLAAATTAAGLGLEVGLVDERPTLGGQIYKQPGLGFVVKDHAGLGRDHLRGRELIDGAEASAAELLTSTSAVAVRDDEVVLVPEGGHARTVSAARIVIAPGAHDRPVVFPGWTLPGVLTAGAAQTIVKTQRVLPAQLHHYGANVLVALEAGPRPGVRDVLRLGAAARGNTALLRDALSYRSQLMRARVPLRFGRIVVRAEGDGRVERVVHAAVDRDWRPLPGTEQYVDADTLCVGYGFVPSVE